MFFQNPKTTQQVGNLLDEVRQYILLQKQSLGVRSSEVAIKLFSALIIVTVLILVGFIVLFFAGMTLATWIGEVLHNPLLGFVITTGVLLLFALLIYLMRKVLIINPVTRFVIELFSPTSGAQNLNDVKQEEDNLEKQLQQKQLLIKAQTQALVAEEQTHKSKMEQFVAYFQNGYNLYRSMQLGVATVTLLHKFFSNGKYC